MVTLTAGTLARIACVVGLATALPAAGWANDPASAGREIELLDPGKAPRQVLRYRLVPGQAEMVVVEIATTVVLAVADLKPPAVNAPLLRFTLQLKVGSVSAGDMFVMTGSVSKVEVLPGPGVTTALVKAVSNDLLPLNGQPLAAIITPQGVLSDVKIALVGDSSTQLATAARQLAQALPDLFVPLPKEPVGAGASWQRRSTTSLAGAQVQQTSRYQLTKGGSGRATKGATKGTTAKGTTTTAGISLKIVQAAREQTVAVAGLPPGATVTLRSLHTTGTGTASVDFAKLGNAVKIALVGKATGVAQSQGEAPAEVTLGTSVSMTMLPVQ